MTTRTRMNVYFDPALLKQVEALALRRRGRLDFFESALAFMAGYGLKGFLIAQSLNQIERAYGSLYLVVPPSDINRTKPLIRLILNQIGRRLTEELIASGKRHRLLLMLDEFPALARQLRDQRRAHRQARV